MLCNEGNATLLLFALSLQVIISISYYIKKLPTKI